VVLDRCQQLAPVSAGSGDTGLRARCEIFSFYATKCISTGSGGAVATMDQALHECITDLNSHDKRESYLVPRHNFQFDDIRAAVGVAQLGQLAGFVAARHSHAAAYATSLGHGDHSRRAASTGMVFRYLLDCGGGRVRAELELRMADLGIEAKQPVYRPLHRYMGLDDADFPLATHAWERMLSLPLYPTLSDADRERVIAAILGGKSNEYARLAP
jgi:perosamine synthetase